VTPLHERNNRFVRIRLEEGGGCFGRGASLFSVTNPINYGNKNSTLAATHQMVIARFTLSGKDKLRHAIFDQRYAYCFHFFTVTVVPRPGWEVI